MKPNPTGVCACVRLPYVSCALFYTAFPCCIQKYHASIKATHLTSRVHTSIFIPLYTTPQSSLVRYVKHNSSQIHPSAQRCWYRMYNTLYYVNRTIILYCTWKKKKLYSSNVRAKERDPSKPISPVAKSKKLLPPKKTSKKNLTSSRKRLRKPDRLLRENSPTKTRKPLASRKLGLTAYLWCACVWANDKRKVDQKITNKARNPQNDYYCYCCYYCQCMSQHFNTNFRPNRLYLLLFYSTPVLLQWGMILYVPTLNHTYPGLNRFSLLLFYHTWYSSSSTLLLHIVTSESRVGPPVLYSFIPHSSNHSSSNSWKTCTLRHAVHGCIIGRAGTAVILILLLSLIQVSGKKKNYIYTSYIYILSCFYAHRSYTYHSEDGTYND